MIIEDILNARKKTNLFPPNYSLNYYNVRNNAWEFLIKNNVLSYPLNLNNMADNNNWYIWSYKEYCQFKKLSEKDLIKQFPDGFTSKTNNGTYIICYNENNSKHRNRFTICHEIGHIVLQHIYKDEDKLEKEANMFSARILMPMLLIKELNITTAEKLSKICDVSLEAATNRLKRYNETIYQRNKFYTNPREQKLYNQLKNFIDRTKE